MRWVVPGSVENEQQSAERIIPELQDLKVGDVIEIAPEIWGIAWCDLSLSVPWSC